MPCMDGEQWAKQREAEASDLNKNLTRMLCQICEILFSSHEVELDFRDAVILLRGNAYEAEMIPELRNWYKTHREEDFDLNLFVRLVGLLKEVFPEKLKELKVDELISEKIFGDDAINIGVYFTDYPPENHSACMITLRQ